MSDWRNVQFRKLHLISCPWKVPVFLVSLSCSYCLTMRQRNEQIYLYLTCLLLNYCGSASARHQTQISCQNAQQLSQLSVWQFGFSPCCFHRSETEGIKFCAGTFPSSWTSSHRSSASWTKLATHCSPPPYRRESWWTGSCDQCYPYSDLLSLSSWQKVPCFNHQPHCFTI